MTEWYYAADGAQQAGPVSAQQLVDLLQAGSITPNTLVWRTGLDNWQPLQHSLEELGVHAVVPSAPERALEPVSEPVLDPVPESARPAANHQFGAVDTSASPYVPPTSAVLGEEPIVKGGEVVYAGFWKRVAAYTIDAIVVGMVGGIIGGVIGGMLGVMLLGTGSTSANTSGMLIIQGLANLAGVALGVAYFGWMHSSSSMATLGKMAIGIKVVREDGSRISFMRGMGRYFALIVSSIPLGFGFVMAGFTERKRALHDMMCDTVVVDKWAFTAHPELQRRELGTVTIIVLVLFGLLLVVGLLAVVAAVVFAARALH